MEARRLNPRDGLSLLLGRDDCNQGVMKGLSLSLAHILVLCLLAACGSPHAQTAIPGASETETSPTALSCTGDAECPSGQRCGFTSDCISKGTCVVPSNTTQCIDPGGRCGCDGRPVDIFCAVGSHTEYTSAPTNAVGPCRSPCNASSQCRSGLVCQNGFCAKP